MRPLAVSQSSDVNMVDGHVSTHSVDGSLGSAPSVVNSVGYGQSACEYATAVCVRPPPHQPSAASHQPPATTPFTASEIVDTVGSWAVHRRALEVFLREGVLLGGCQSHCGQGPATLWRRRLHQRHGRGTRLPRVAGHADLRGRERDSAQHDRKAVVGGLKNSERLRTRQLERRPLANGRASVIYNQTQGTSCSTHRLRKQT